VLIVVGDDKIETDESMHMLSSLDASQTEWIRHYGAGVLLTEEMPTELVKPFALMLNGLVVFVSKMRFRLFWPKIGRLQTQGYTRLGNPKAATYLEPACREPTQGTVFSSQWLVFIRTAFCALVQ
jgi:hypothetical protein